MDLWQMILADHANIRELCREVLYATGSRPNSREDLFDDLDIEIERHMHGKERVLFPRLAAEPRLRDHVAELKRLHGEIRHRLEELSDEPDKDDHVWAQDFKELESIIGRYFDLEESRVLPMARSVIDMHEADRLRRSLERTKIASLEARRWHLPERMMPGGYGLSTGAVVGVLAGAAALGAAAFMWTRSQSRSGQNRPLRAVYRRPEPPFPLRAGAIDTRLEGQGRAAGMSSGDRRGDADLRETQGFSSAHPPQAPSGLESNLQPGGVVPGGGPAASVGSIGTGGGQTANRDTGSMRRG